MYIRTYGWVQNPSDFEKLKLVVQILDPDSEHYQRLRDSLINELIVFEDLKNHLLDKFQNRESVFSYSELVGSSRDYNGVSAKSRADAVADGLIQITILPQSHRTTGKRWTDNWTSDGYLRWALSLNFVKHDIETDNCTITELGILFSRSQNNSNQERTILQQALLAYPPASRVLRILSEANRAVTKFYIGKRLGFKGEKGFTSYPEDLMKDWFIESDAELQKKIKSDIEGTADKYARMISKWLEKVGYVNTYSTTVETLIGQKAGFPEYRITAAGLHALRQSEGSSRNTRITKYLTWEFLATAGNNRNYVRTRRAYILKYLENTNSYSVLKQNLASRGFNESEEIITNDIQGLNNIGIEIVINANNVQLKDKLIDFSIPNLNVTDELRDAELERRRSEMMAKTDLDAQYYELLEIAYDGRRNRDFEILTIDLFKEAYGYQGKLLGGGRKPDGIIFTSDYGVIVDTKAYGQGYSKSISQEDEMVRYIEDNQLKDPTRNPTQWWTHFPNSIAQSNYYFLWVSSYFIGHFPEQLTSTSQRTSANGAALNVEQLLIGADLVQKGILSLNEIMDHFSNEEIEWS